MTPTPTFQDKKYLRAQKRQFELYNLAIGFFSWKKNWKIDFALKPEVLPISTCQDFPVFSESVLSGS